MLTPERVSRWRTAWTYEQGLLEVGQVLDAAGDHVLGQPVPSCPEWSVGDLLAHLAGVATDSLAGAFFAGAMQAWCEPRRRCAGRVDVRARRPPRPTEPRAAPRAGAAGARLAAELRHGTPPVAGAPDWGLSAPVGDLCVHLDDLREALGREPVPSSPVTRWGFASFRGWLHQRLVQTRLPALVLMDGDREWTVGDGPPTGSVTADRYELSG